MTDPRNPPPGFHGKISAQQQFKGPLLLSAFGFLMIQVSVVLNQYVVPHSLWILLTECGFVWLIVAVVGFLRRENINKASLEQALKNQEKAELGMRDAEQALQAWRQQIEIASHCFEHQLVDVMPYDKQEFDRAHGKVNTAVKDAQGEICILGATLANNLLDESLIRVICNKFRSDPNASVKLLLIDFKSAAENICAVAEGFAFNPEDSGIRKEVLRSANYVEGWRNNGWKVEAGFCNVLPGFYMVSTPKELFIEPCHLESKSHGHSSIIRKTPFFRFSRDSEMYKSATSHFSYIWSHMHNGNVPFKRQDDVIQVRNGDAVFSEMNRRKKPRPVIVEFAA